MRTTRMMTKLIPRLGRRPRSIVAGALPTAGRTRRLLLSQNCGENSVRARSRLLNSSRSNNGICSSSRICARIDDSTAKMNGVVRDFDHLFPKNCNLPRPLTFEDSSSPLSSPSIDSERPKRIKRLERSVFRECYRAPSKRTATSRAFFLKSTPSRTSDDVDKVFRHVEAIAQKSILKRAVDRNRVKRRLREAARLVLPTYACAEHQYLLVARAPAMLLDFREIQWDLISALRDVGCLAKEPPNVAAAVSSISESRDNETGDSNRKRTDKGP